MIILLKENGLSRGLLFCAGDKVKLGCFVSFLISSHLCLKVLIYATFWKVFNIFLMFKFFIILQDLGSQLEVNIIKYTEGLNL